MFKNLWAESTSIGLLEFNRMILTVLACLCVMASHAYSMTIVYQFEGAIGGPEFNGDNELAGIPDGTPYIGRFSYESDAPPLGPPSPLLGQRYMYNFLEITIGTGKIFADLSRTGPGIPSGIFITNGPSRDTFVVRANRAGGSVGTLASVNSFGVGFSGGPDVFSDTSLPGPNLTRDAFRFANISVSGTTDGGVPANFSGGVTSLSGDSVPEIPIPPAIWLFVSALGMLVYLGKQKRAT